MYEFSGGLIRLLLVAQRERFGWHAAEAAGEALPEHARQAPPGGGQARMLGGYPDPRGGRAVSKGKARSMNA